MVVERKFPMDALVSYDLIALEFSRNRTRFMSSEYPEFSEDSTPVIPEICWRRKGSS